MMQAMLRRMNLRFRPRLFDCLQHYSRERFVQDIFAGISVGIIALPLSMAFSIASGLKPEQGLYTAIIAGFCISAFGGTRFSIGGPAGAAGAFESRIRDELHWTPRIAVAQSPYEI